MNGKLKEKISEALSSVLPITAIVLILSITLVPMDIGTLALFIVGAILLIIGMGFFQLGAEMSVSPLGKSMGSSIVKTGKLTLILFICLFMGIIITVAEPDLMVLANQITTLSNATIIYTVAIGVGIFLVIAFLRIYFKISLAKMLSVFYLLVFIIAFFAPEDFRPVAFDSGGVTTGPMTVPFIMTLGIGFSAARTDKEGTSDSFGLIALCSVGPILSVLLLGMIFNITKLAPNTEELAPIIHSTTDVTKYFYTALPHYANEVFMSMLPVIAVFIIFELITRTYRLHQMLRISIGFVYTILGLLLFLTGVNVGFAPVGSLLGKELGLSEYRLLLIPIGALIGYFIVKAEPAVQVLNSQVEEITSGMISQKMMNSALSIGVSLAVVLSMIRVVTGLNIFYILVPGYLIALVLSKFVPPIFVGIAFDSGGVASGPMTSTFLLPLAMGASIGVGGNVVADAFGVVALVALSPLITIQLMGVIYKYRSRALSNKKEITPDTVIEFEESE